MSVSDTHSRLSQMALAGGDQPIPTLKDLLQLSPAALERVGLACVSLVCATGLPGAEDVDIPAYLARVKEWAALVRQRIPRLVHAFKSNPADFNNSEAYFLASVLVQVLKKDIGIHYNPDRMKPSEANASLSYPDSRDLLIHGPLGPTLAGTCNNIPMAVVAVGRELGYPVYLATTPHHVYAKWAEPNGYTFNIEATNPAGMTSQGDEHYQDEPVPMPETILCSGYYMRPLHATDELALCMMSRGWVLEANNRYAAAALAHAHACRLAPTEPMYPRIAARYVGRWMRKSYNASVSEEHQIPCKNEYQHKDLFLDPQRLLPQEYMPLALTILARHYEIQGKAGPAAAIYSTAASLHRDKRKHLNGSNGFLPNVEQMVEQCDQQAQGKHLEKQESVSC